MQITSSLDKILTPTAIALGNFDGIHRGHLEVIKPVLETDDAGVYKTVVTFDPHPQQYFTGQQRQLLTPHPERTIILESLGVQQLVLLAFDRELVKLSPQEFVQQILNDRLQAKFVSVGEDFRFGNQRAGAATDLVKLTADIGICTRIAPLETDGDSRISSSRIRAALLAADLELTKELLGRYYSIVGTVINGQEIGRSIGFPTANLKYPPEKFLPRQGVYCVRVDTATATQLPGVMNIGKRPTVNGVNTTVEVHLLDWDGNLYGQQLIVYLHHFLRSEQKFPDLAALTNQIQADCDAARQFFGS
ncbi:bifunctional riboflavin kinase/FAD synthetase [Chamaesiphon minutus]|uniref:Riboflavin biosynthesis protein n=1 Tax=Chamaesiphon minutus (strain ATCC 27169 / PCC 6605) TaxID=1173020 RepID=K9UPD7_CHAP6|nr:bifunctional riboflavin kinase/FAD synthetase [Chamaesiphon minutus]AFY96685.1 riboflavin kinase/FMN adenylyltransferase [Chamaesiphon minutus PCC 6605]